MIIYEWLGAQCSVGCAVCAPMSFDTVRVYLEVICELQTLMLYNAHIVGIMGTLGTFTQYNIPAYDHDENIINSTTILKIATHYHSVRVTVFNAIAHVPEIICQRGGGVAMTH